MATVVKTTIIKLDKGEYGKIDINPTAHTGYIIPVAGPCTIEIKEADETSHERT